MSVRPEIERIGAALDRIEQKLDDLVASLDAYQTAVKPARRAIATK